MVGAAALALLSSPFFRIQVVDAANGRGVPMVELRTVNQLRFVTDSNGLVAFNEPGLMDRDVFFHVTSHGYSLKADGFGYRGLALKTTPGASGTIRLERENIAERLYRLTGQGIYRDTELLGEKPPIASPTLNGGVMGQDTAQAEVYRGKLMWFWGDTDRTGYPLGNFHTSGAVAKLPPEGPDRAIEFTYFTGKDGFVRPMVESKESMPIWVSGLAVLGKGKTESLFAYYAQMRKLGETASSGYLKWNDTAERFEIVQTFGPDRAWRFMDSHLIRDQGFMLGNLPPNVRVPANEKSLLSADPYEAYTPLEADGTVRRVNGKPNYRWQKSLPPLTPQVEKSLLEKGQLNPDEVHFLPRDAGGEVIVPHGGSVHWNAYRKRWIMIFTRLGGKDSALGEIYYSEAAQPTGPFLRATKILTHQRYTFYNPVHHAFLDRDGGRTIYFEGTYTAEFSGNEDKTPLYNYNQLLYKLDLSNPKLKFAQSE